MRLQKMCISPNRTSQKLISRNSRTLSDGEAYCNMPEFIPDAEIAKMKEWMLI